MIQIISIGERGLVVTFSKDDLLNIKSGGVAHGDLVGEGGKTKIMFMRDTKFKDMQQKFSKKVTEEAVREAYQGAVAKAESLGESIGIISDGIQ